MVLRTCGGEGGPQEEGFEDEGRREAEWETGRRPRREQDTAAPSVGWNKHSDGKQDPNTAPSHTCAGSSLRDALRVGTGGAEERLAAGILDAGRVGRWGGGPGGRAGWVGGGWQAGVGWVGGG